jgi:hypothetical protein
MELEKTTVDYDDISEGVRRFAAERYYDLERSLRPLVDNTFGEILPGHVAAYIACLKELGRLYQTHKPPRALQNLVPMDKVQQILAGMRAQQERELGEAVALAEARVRAELSHGQQLSITAARAQVLEKLDRVAQRS